VLVIVQTSGNEAMDFPPLINLKILNLISNFHFPVIMLSSHFAFHYLSHLIEHFGETRLLKLFEFAKKTISCQTQIRIIQESKVGHKTKKL
jgi:hypothetical protein